MIYITLLIPIVTITILAIWFREKTTFVEYIIVLIPSVLLVISLNYIFIEINTSDKEFIGHIVKNIRYYEPWNEYVKRTCSHTYKVGKTTRTIYYDCSYIRYHSERWVKISSDGESYDISKDEYNKLLKKFGTKRYFVELNRNYHTIDGNMYVTDFDGNILKTEGVTETNIYENKIQASHSIFKLEDISENEARKLGLYEYPDINSYNQNPIIGIKIHDTILNKFYYINGVIGEKKQMRCYMFVYKNKPISIAFKQRSYMDGFNKNEFIICVGINNNNEIVWNKNFSWEDKPVLATKLRNYLNEQSKFNPNDIANFMIKNSGNMWKRKNFKDFDYIQIHVTDNQLLVIVFIVLIFNILISFWIITNDIVAGRHY
jgi:hypothetical protein